MFTKEQQKTYAQSPSGKIARQAARKKFTAKYPEKKSAKNAVYIAVKNGIIRRSVFVSPAASLRSHRPITPIIVRYYRSIGFVKHATLKFTSANRATLAHITH